MATIGSLGADSWLSIFGALALFLGPGFALLSWYPGTSSHDRTTTSVMATSLSLAAWPILLAWLRLLEISLSPPTIAGVLVGSWLLYFARLPHLRQAGLGRPQLDRIRDPVRTALWLVAALTFASGLWLIRNTVSGLGSDSYHHTLISQMIAQTGGIPRSYEPFAPLITFSYHYGFHSFVAAISELSKVEARLLVPILGQAIVWFSVLSTALLAETLQGDRKAGLVAAVFVGLVSVFPAFMLNWGRFTQLAGLAMLPIFLTMLENWIRHGFQKRELPFIGVLAAGVILTHYRVAVMALVGAIVLVAGHLLNRRPTSGRISMFRTILGLLTAASISAFLISPWILVVGQGMNSGSPVNIGRSSPAFHNLARIGTGAIHFPTNAVVIALALTAVTLGIVLRLRSVLSMAAWSALLVGLAASRVPRFVLDIVSVAISLCLPASVAIGCAATAVIDGLRRRSRLLTTVAWTGIAALSIWGLLASPLKVETSNAFVTPDDLAAMDWIRASTDDSAYFMVSMFSFDYSPRFIIGSDAGYWIPALALRRTVTVPMVYSIERTNDPGFLERLVELNQLGGHLTSLEAIALLRSEHVTHVYLGEKGTLISEAELLSSPDFRLAYRVGGARVFEFLPGKGP